MPLRETLKRGLKQAKGDVKGLFKGQPATKDTGTGWKCLTELTTIIRPAAQSLGPVKQAIDLFAECIGIFEIAASGQIRYEALQVRLERLFEELANHLKSGPPAMTESMESLCRVILKELDSIKLKQNRPDWRHYLAARGEEDEILDHYSRIADSLERLSLNANLSIWKIVDQHSTEYRSDHMFSLVDRLRPSLSACYNSSEGAELKRRACTPDTRVNVLDRILDWTGSGEGSIYWLNGMAGTGKTTVAYSVCERLDSKQEHKLAASFFCSRLRDECRNVSLIFPSIAYQLARFSRPFLSALSDTLQQNPDLHTRSLRLQFEGLIAKPLNEVANALPERLVIVIDALDECDNEDSTRQMLGLLLSEETRLPIRFIISSRPEPQIRDQMNNKRILSGLVLHELDISEVQTDIETYLRQELKPMSPPLTDAQIIALVERAGKLFIYAATVVRYIGYDNFRSDPTSRLGDVMDGPQSPENGGNKEIDKLYVTILEGALNNQDLRQIQRNDMRQVLYTVICAREPLTVRSLSELLGIKDAERVRTALRPLWSVLHVIDGREIVTTLHASFPDFMFDSTRSNTYWCDSHAQHRRIAERCFEQIRHAKPQFNICGLESSYLSDRKVPDIERRVANAISSELLYACRYWSDHVNAAGCASEVVDQLQDFLSTRLLLWMEVLNLNNQMKVAIVCMTRTTEWGAGLEGNQELIELAHDAKRFIEAFASNPVSHSTPHIYISMLAFWPKSAPITKHYAKYTRGPVKPQGTALDRRQLAHLSTWAFEGSVQSIALSPDGSHAALANEEDVVVVELSSGRVVTGPLKGHTDWIAAVGLTTDGCVVSAGSYAGETATILSWDTRTGNEVLSSLQLQGHTGKISCLSLSSDCSCIATGSKDKTVRLWDAQTGKILLQLEAQGEIDAVVFSPDGTRVAAGCGNTLQIWDSQSDHTIHGPVADIDLTRISLIALSPDNSRVICADIYNNTVQVRDVQGDGIVFRQIAEHPVDVSCIAYSPDGKHLVSGDEDGAVRVWDVQTGNMVLGPLQGHTRAVSAVTFTPDGSRVISACDGGLVCTWDAHQHSLVPSSTSTPFDSIRCVKFSSDGAHFVSGSREGTICIWDAYTGEMVAGPVKVHTSQIQVVDFKNGHVVSGSGDGKICACDALTGQVVLGPLNVGSGAIYAVAHSHDGKLIATGSDDGVNVWNAQDGRRMFGPLTDLGDTVLSVQFSPDGTRTVAGSGAFRYNIVVLDVSDGSSVFGFLDGHHDPVRSVSYSPNGALIASGSDDHTIILWDAYTGRKAIGPLTGHFNYVLSVSFSPDSTRLVSCSEDRTIRIWDVQTGEMVFDLSHGHEGWILSVEYSPDGTCIMSCSYDGSVRIHDARSPDERARSRPKCEVGDWTINKDGWVVDDQSNLLVWVPGDLRKALIWPSTLQVRLPPGDELRLKFDKSRMGKSWARGYTSQM